MLMKLVMPLMPVDADCVYASAAVPDARSSLCVSISKTDHFHTVLAIAPRNFKVAISFPC